MSKIVKNIRTVQILEDTSVNEATYVKTGYTLFAEPTIKERNQKENTPNVAVGGVYEKSNVSRSHVNLNNVGTLIGSFTLENVPEPDPQLVIYNYLTSLIPGLYPPISGPWTETQDYYNLEEITDYVKNNDNVFFCKTLGLGLGEICSYRVSDVSRSGLSTLGNNTIRAQDAQGFQEGQNELKIINYSSILDGFIAPETEVGESFYMTAYDWPNFYGIETINGTNTFPFFGWAGSRIGSIKPQTFQFQQNSLFNWPSSFLQLSKSYNPLGIIYSGQGVQCNSFPELGSERKITFEQRNIRTYQETINNNESEIKFTGIMPYQQGRGSFDYLSREVVYNQANGLVDYVELQGVIPCEGALPGRNNAFLGVTLTDYWSDNLNLNNTENSSTTPEDTRMIIPGLKQSKTAHNAPLSYISKDSNNSYNPLPWNSLWSYIGTTTTSSSNKRSDNTPILKNGITTMSISGAYPLYRGTHSSTYSGTNEQFILSGCVVYDQYYATTEFFDPSQTDPVIPQIEDRVPIQTEAPYRIKGGRIVLAKGQRVKAGSYVYVCMNMVGNVSVPQYYSPAAKDIVLNEGERDQLLGDIYSKLQANQGSLIVMASIDGEEPPNPPSCAQPVGVVLEDVEGFGEALYVNDNPAENVKYVTDFKAEINNFVATVYNQPAYDFTKTNCIQARDILIKTFPMYPNMSLSDVVSGRFFFLFIAVAFPYTVAFGDQTITDSFGAGSGDLGFSPICTRIKSNYLIEANPEAVGLSAFETEIGGFGLSRKEFTNEWPPLR